MTRITYGCKPVILLYFDPRFVICRKAEFVNPKIVMEQ